MSWSMSKRAALKVINPARRERYLQRLRAGRCSCRRQCLANAVAEADFCQLAAENWCCLHTCPKDLQDLLLNQYLQPAPRGGPRKSYDFLGRPVCREALIKLLGIGKTRQQRARAGCVDMRSAPGAGRGKANAAASSDVFSFLWGIYTSVAEFCPNHDVPLVAGRNAIVKRELEAALETLGIGPSETDALIRQQLEHPHGFPKRFLPPGHPKEYYWQYLGSRGCLVDLEAGRAADGGDHQPGAQVLSHRAPQPGAQVLSHRAPGGVLPVASYSTFKRVWRTCFEPNLLGFTRFHRFAICDVCSELKALMRTAPSAKERVFWASRYAEHQDDQMADRRVYYRAREMSRKGELLCIIQDGSDQAKYRVVRTIRAPKSMDLQHCPRLKLLGSMAHGYVSSFWFIEADVVHDSQTSIEALMCAIEEVRLECERTGRELPHDLWIQLDNAPAENKNQYVFAWAAVMVARSVFRSVTLAFLRVGHTHEDLDGVWGVNQTVLGSVERWDCPQEIMAHTRGVVAPLCGPGTVVRRLDFVRDWKAWLQPLHLKGFPGIGPGPASPHFFHFAMRKDIPARMIGRTPPGGHPGDVLLEVRQFMASSEPSQDLLLVLPEGMAAPLAPVPQSAYAKFPAGWYIYIYLVYI